VQIVRVVIYSVAVGQVFLQVLPFFPVNVPLTQWVRDSDPIKPTEEVEFHVTSKRRRNKELKTERKVTENKQCM
jgi:hypothetical protein